MGYGSDGLSLYGTEPVTVEYFLGTDLDVEKVAFTFISPEFFSGEDFYYIRPFEGEACFYNNETKNYDPVDLSGGGFTESVLAPYLSAENSLVVKYTAEEGGHFGSYLDAAGAGGDREETLMLKIHGLKKKFGNFEAPRGLDMEVEEGALYGFVGPNGAGKTTAIKIMAGLLKPDEGSVEICGKDALRFGRRQRISLAMCPMSLACMTI